MKFTVLWAKTIQSKICKSTFTFVSSKNSISGMSLFWLPREKKKGRSKTCENRRTEDLLKRKKNRLSRANSSLVLNLSQILKSKASIRKIKTQRRIFIMVRAPAKAYLGKTGVGCCVRQKDRSRSKKGGRSGKTFKSFLTMIRRTTYLTAIGTTCWVCQMSSCMRWIKRAEFSNTRRVLIEREIGSEILMMVCIWI